MNIQVEETVGMIKNANLDIMLRGLRIPVTDTEKNTAADIEDQVVKYQKKLGGLILLKEKENPPGMREKSEAQEIEF